MAVVANILIGLIAVLHLYILVLEMFLWTAPRGLAAFGQTPEQARASATLAANQGLYNGFLAAGLVFGLVAGDPDVAYAFKLFFLGCVIVAGLYGGATVGIRIFLIQALPAIVALVILVLA